MSIEEEVFKKGKILFSKLEDYGFQLKDGVYQYSKEFMKHFKAFITITLDGCVSGKIMDLRMNDEYLSYRVKDLTGFASEVREEYILILKDIYHHVCMSKYFVFDQTNRIANLIDQEYAVLPEFLWERDPSSGVFRNKSSGKWFGIVMNIDRSKIIPDKTGKVEVLNLKLDYQKSHFTGVYPAYHMNKKSWVSIILDDTLTDEEIMEMVSVSYELSSIHHDWIIPVNLEVFNIIKALSRTDVLYWHQDINVNVGDFIYIYVTKPCQEVLFKCKVLEANVLLNDVKSMKLKVIERYQNHEYPIELLNQYGVKSVRGARSVPKKLSELFQK